MIYLIKIEKINQAELDELSLLYYDLVKKESIKNKMIGSFQKINQNPNYYLLGVKTDDKLIGSAMAIICYDLIGECRPFMVIENVIIAKDYRGKGYGSILLKKIEDIAKEHNCYYIMLISNKNRKNSHKFYKKLGYNCDSNVGFKKYL